MQSTSRSDSDLADMLHPEQRNSPGGNRTNGKIPPAMRRSASANPDIEPVCRCAPAGSFDIHSQPIPHFAKKSCTQQEHGAQSTFSMVPERNTGPSGRLCRKNDSFSCLTIIYTPLDRVNLGFSSTVKTMGIASGEIKLRRYVYLLRECRVSVHE